MDGKRAVTAVVLAVGFTWLASVSSVTTYLCVVAAMAAVALREFMLMTSRDTAGIHRWIAWLVGVAFVFVGVLPQQAVPSWDAVVVACGMVICLGLQLTRRTNYASSLGLALSIFGALYIGWLAGFIVRLRQLPDGIGWVMLLVLATKCGDMGSYLIGKRWGRHALLKRISPNKSVEGAVGGLACSVLGAAVVRACWWPHSVTEMILLGALLGAVGQVGDLVESMFKRDYQVKDSGRLFPGIGGMLDLMDSVLFAAPVLYAYVLVVYGRG